MPDRKKDTFQIRNSIHHEESGTAHLSKLVNVRGWHSTFRVSAKANNFSNNETVTVVILYLSDVHLTKRI